MALEGGAIEAATDAIGVDSIVPLVVDRSGSVESHTSRADNVPGEVVGRG